MKAQSRLAQIGAEYAVDLLAPIYRWVTEGFDTRVLTDAKALLDAATRPARMYSYRAGRSRPMAHGKRPSSLLVAMRSGR
jgi:hypothetical protein